MRATPAIQYKLTDEAWDGYKAFLEQLVIERHCRTICEIGGGANPALDLEFVQKYEIDYIIVDISPGELAKAPKGYRTRVLDVSQPVSGEEGCYDLVFSKMLAEHVSDASMFHRNMCRLLKPRGAAFHFFPTLYSPPFVLNLLLPERITYWLLNRIQKGREKSGRNAKFPAYYQWCRGPFDSQISKLEQVGFHVVQYIGFFGHPGYYKKVPQIERVHRWISNWFQKHPTPWLTSFAYVVLEKR